jgi:hypothetical protein
MDTTLRIVDLDSGSFKLVTWNPLVADEVFESEFEALLRETFGITENAWVDLIELTTSTLVAKNKEALMNFKAQPNRQPLALTLSPVSQAPLPLKEDDIYEVTFTEPSLGITSRESTLENVIVDAFRSNPDGTLGFAEASGKINLGDIVYKVGDTSTIGCDYDSVIQMLRNPTRPLTVYFFRPRMREGLYAVEFTGASLNMTISSNEEHVYVSRLPQPFTNVLGFAEAHGVRNGDTLHAIGGEILNGPEYGRAISLLKRHTRPLIVVFWRATVTPQYVHTPMVESNLSLTYSNIQNIMKIHDDAALLQSPSTPPPQLCEQATSRPTMVAQPPPVVAQHHRASIARPSTSSSALLFANPDAGSTFGVRAAANATNDNENSRKTQFTPAAKMTRGSKLDPSTHENNHHDPHHQFHPRKTERVHQQQHQQQQHLQQHHPMPKDAHERHYMSMRSQLQVQRPNVYLSVPNLRKQPPPAPGHTRGGPLSFEAAAAGHRRSSEQSDMHSLETALAYCETLVTTGIISMEECHIVKEMLSAGRGDISSAIRHENKNAVVALVRSPTMRLWDHLLKTSENILLAGPLSSTTKKSKWYHLLLTNHGRLLFVDKTLNTLEDEILCNQIVTVSSRSKFNELTITSVSSEYVLQDTFIGSPVWVRAILPFTNTQGYLRVVVGGSPANSLLANLSGAKKRYFVLIGDVLHKYKKDSAVYASHSNSEKPTVFTLRDLKLSVVDAKAFKFEISTPEMTLSGKKMMFVAPSAREYHKWIASFQALQM